MANSSKNDNLDSPYVHEDSDLKKTPRFAWAKSRAVKISAIVAASSLALGATFALGATLGKNIGPGPEGQFGNHAPFDRDGDHKPPFGGQPGGHHDHKGQPGENHDDDDFNLPADPNASTDPSAETGDATINP